MQTATDRQASLHLGIIVDKRPSTHRWADWIWRPSAAYLTSELSRPDWSELHRADALIRYHAGFATLTLHRKDCEALRNNLMLDRPELYAVLRASDARPGFPWAVHAITASPYEAQDFHDGDGVLIEKLPMPEQVAAFVQAFVEAHDAPETFKKRRRDRLDVEEMKFGKTPIFTPVTRQ